MPSTKSRNNKNNNNNKKNRKKKTDEISVVGPEYFQVLQGELFGRHVALVLCGESHYDALDVTRSGGRFSPREGWVELTNGQVVVPTKDDVQWVIAGHSLGGAMAVMDRRYRRAVRRQTRTAGAAQGTV